VGEPDVVAFQVVTMGSHVSGRWRRWSSPPPSAAPGPTRSRRRWSARASTSRSPRSFAGTTWSRRLRGSPRRPRGCCTGWRSCSRARYRRGRGCRSCPGLHEQGVSLALVSSSFRVLVDAVLAHGFGPFEVALTGDEVACSKPDPEPYLTVASRLGVDPANCVVLEDSPAGVASGLAAGCFVPSVAGGRCRARTAAGRRGGSVRRRRGDSARPDGPSVIAVMTQRLRRRIPRLRCRQGRIRRPRDLIGNARTATTTEGRCRP
jgi:hypothetical protein